MDPDFDYSPVTYITIVAYFVHQREVVTGYRKGLITDPVRRG